MDVANKTEIAYEKAANKEEKIILEQRAKETVELLRGTKFSPRRFQLDCQHASLMVAKVTDVIYQKYGRLSMWAKRKFYVKQMKVEIARLKMLTSHSCRRINKMESELKYVQVLKKLELEKQISSRPCVNSSGRFVMAFAIAQMRWTSL